MNNLIRNIIEDIAKIDNKKQLNEFISKTSYEYENSINQEYRKTNGCFYTARTLAADIVDKVFHENGITKTNIATKKFLEPCVGIGNFVFAYLDKIEALQLSEDSILNIINNIYVADVDNDALTIYKQIFSKYIQIVFNYTLPLDYFTNRVASGLLFNLNNFTVAYISLEQAFTNIKEKSFDIIITNPPYRNFKAEIKNFHSQEAYDISVNQICEIKKLAKQYCPYSHYGILNFYRLFMEEILSKYCAENACIGLLIPSTFLTDKTCSKLRTHIITNNSILLVDLIPENNPFLLAKQSLCSIIINSTPSTKKIKMCKNILDKSQGYISINIADILNKETGNAIFSMTDTEYNIFKQLNQYPKLGSLKYVHNLRGELDLTEYRQYITNEKTKFYLVRGRNLGYFQINSRILDEYVMDAFIEKCTKSKYIFSERIACQQVVNLQKNQRVTFSKIPSTYILGNSCNFIAVDNNNDKISLNFLLGVLNSNTINWYFKLLSTNNHVNNYEIDTFPIPIASPYKDEIAELVDEYIHCPNEQILDNINNLVNLSFNLVNFSQPIKQKNDDIIMQKYYTDMRFLIPQIKKDDCYSIINSENIFSFLMSKYSHESDSPYENTFNSISPIIEGITQKYKMLLNNQILNHTTFKLSELDLAMAKPVPQGGNWKDIPLDIAQKSQRVMRIRSTGGRTTLYGRIDYSKPSYTITTYFNRPGNGTYLHPIHNRVLSVREAARLQSFPDSYYFLGNKTALLNQVGNAVPSIMAYHIAMAIRKKLDVSSCIDLFCGAGGLSIGLKMAGIKSVLGIDHDKSACLTYKVNSPETLVLCDDITSENVKQEIINIGINNNIDMLCGGPPCQGFSLAGKRFIDDPRNQLFKHYIDIASKIQPKVILFENVEGLLSFQNGEVYRQIIDLFSSIGYNSEGKVLLSSEYGVPQKRKRIIIICVRKNININPIDLFPIPNKTMQISVKEAIGDLESVSCSNCAYYLNKKNDSRYVSHLKELF